MLGALSLLLNDGGLKQIQVIATGAEQGPERPRAPLRDMINQLNVFAGTLDQQKDDITNALGASTTWRSP